MLNDFNNNIMPNNLELTELRKHNYNLLDKFIHNNFEKLKDMINS